MCKHFFVKIFFLVLSASLPFFVPETAYSQRNSEVYSIGAVNFPDYYIRHRDFLTYLEKINDDQASKDAAFIVVNGLSGKCNSFMIRTNTLLKLLIFLIII
jgi:hypothetical protein